MFSKTLSIITSSTCINKIENKKWKKTKNFLPVSFCSVNYNHWFKKIPQMPESNCSNGNIVSYDSNNNNKKKNL